MNKNDSLKCISYLSDVIGLLSGKWGRPHTEIEVVILQQLHDVQETVRKAYEAEQQEESRLDVTIRCYQCEHIHKTFNNIELAVFIPRTLKEWADLPCPICHSVGHEIVVETHEQERPGEP